MNMILFVLGILWQQVFVLSSDGRIEISLVSANIASEYDSDGQRLRYAVVGTGEVFTLWFQCFENTNEQSVIDQIKKGQLPCEYRFKSATAIRRSRVRLLGRSTTRLCDRSGRYVVDILRSRGCVWAIASWVTQDCQEGTRNGVVKEIGLKILKGDYVVRP